MLKSESQKHLVQVATQVVPLPQKETHRLQAYQELVFHRFYEVISNCFPIMMEHVGSKIVRPLVVRFMQQKPKTLFIWQSPNEFRRFVKEEDELQAFPFIHDLLWFEWIEVELFMKEYGSLHVSTFSWEDEYRLGNNAVIKSLSYKVFEREFKTPGEYWVLGYYDIASGDVYFRELNEVLYLFLETQERVGTKAALQTIAALAEADEESVKAVLEEALVTLCANHVIIKDEK